MFKNMSRAERRHHRARLMKTRKNYWGYGNQGWRSYCQDAPEEMSPAMVGTVARTPTPCSCYMCGNPRRTSWGGKEKLTIAERRMLEYYKYSLEELEEENNEFTT